MRLSQKKYRSLERGATPNGSESIGRVSGSVTRRQFITLSWSKLKNPSELFCTLSGLTAGPDSGILRV
jgi:hypothetical protein